MTSEIESFLAQQKGKSFTTDEAIDLLIQNGFVDETKKETESFKSGLRKFLTVQKMFTRSIRRQMTAEIKSCLASFVKKEEKKGKEVTCQQALFELEKKKLITQEQKKDSVFLQCLRKSLRAVKE